jgi:2-dehydro-3-deoxygluconokinase
VQEPRPAGVDVACVGETMLLLVPDPPRPPDEADTFRRDIGGAESNVAIHLARRGRASAWVSALGSDAFGAYVRSRVGAEGVDCAAVRRVDGARTGLYVKELMATGTTVAYYRDGSAACTLGPDDADAVFRLRPRVMHTTGITAALSPGSRALVQRLLEDAPSTVLRSFDVNYRPTLHTDAARETLRDLARRADLVFCGADEAEALWGVHRPQEVAELLGPAGCVVVKQGADGASAFCGGRTWHQPAPDVPVVEAVGAGDGFCAGVLDAVLDGALDVPDLDEALARGAALAGEVLQVDADLPPHELAR